jgi:putative ABC transport system permease protein
MTSSIPLSGGTSTNVVLAEGRVVPPGESPMTAMRVHVTPGYLETLRVPLKRGRYFDARDTERTEQVVIVDTRLAERLWPGQDPIGRHMGQGSDARSGRGWQTVVGVVGEVKQIGLVADRPVGGVYYYPIAQYASPGLTIAVRTTGEPATMVNSLRQAVAASDPALPVYRIRTYEEVADDSLLMRRWPMLVTTAFGIVALLLAAIGLYGVLAYLVSQRTREIGIRMALGGTPGAIMQFVSREGLLLVAGGFAAGALGVVALKRTLEGQLYGVQAGDPGVLAAAALVLGVIAFLACAIPARRATRIDPVRALNQD